MEGIRLDGDLARAQLAVSPATVSLAAVAASAPRVVAGAALPVVFALRNSGGVPARGLTARIVTEDPWVTVEPTEAALNAAPAGQYLPSSGLYAGEALRVRFAPDLAEPHAARLQIQVLAQGQVVAHDTLAVTGVPSVRITGVVHREEGAPLAGVLVTVATVHCPNSQHQPLLLP